MEINNTLINGFKNILKPHILALWLSIMWTSSAIAHDSHSNLIKELNLINTSSKTIENSKTKNNVNKFIKYLKKLEDKYDNIDLNNEKQLLLLLRDVNILVNVQIRYTDDKKLYWKSDYWATWVESIGYWKWDCDDYAILKREILTSFWIDQEKLKLEYCITKKWVSHLVLWYKIGNKNITLDNNSRWIYDNNEEKRVRIIYSIDDNYIYSKWKKIGHNKWLSKFASYKKRAETIDNKTLLASI